MVSFVKKGIRAALSSDVATHLPSTPIDTPHAAPRYNPEFHVDRTHTAGGVIEQTETALRKYIRSGYWSGNRTPILVAIGPAIGHV